METVQAGRTPTTATATAWRILRQCNRQLHSRYPAPSRGGAAAANDEGALFCAARISDLIGLAPTPNERDAYLNDTFPDAYERMVNRLLERPEYGERWARHWMDIWRYSDWAGYKAALRDSQRHIWHWRDWIVESLNADKPYDQMIREMIAADELHPEDADKLRGTGYLARHYFANRQQWMDNVVTHTSQAFLGITLGCSKCHDHMYDDFPMKDYYAMRAIFESYNVRTDRVAGQLDIMRDGIPRAYDQSVTSKTYMFERGDERRPIRDQAIQPDVLLRWEAATP